MCMSCGCKMPNEDHGNPNHITMHDLERAADADGMTVEQVVQNIYDTFSEVGEGETAGVAGETAGRFEPGRTEQSFEERQQGYGSGTSQSPQ